MEACLIQVEVQNDYFCFNNMYEPERTVHTVQYQNVISNHVPDLLLRGSGSLGGK